MFWVGLTEVWHFWVYHAEPGEKLGSWWSSKAIFNRVLNSATQRAYVLDISHHLEVTNPDPTVPRVSIGIKRLFNPFYWLVAKLSHLPGEGVSVKQRQVHICPRRWNGLKKTRGDERAPFTSLPAAQSCPAPTHKVTWGPESPSLLPDSDCIRSLGKT